jgi:lauroyl/myristoyl acyltransferase
VTDATTADLESRRQERDGLTTARDEGHDPIPQDDGASSARLLVRLYASKHVHRLMPASIALAITSVLGTPGRRHQKADELRRSERLMKDLLLYTPRAGEARALARRNVAEMSRLRELFWRPWLLKHSRVIGQEHWQAAWARGRGCVVVVSHLGAVYAVSRILRQKGFYHYAVATPRYWEAQAPGYPGLETRYLHTEYAEAVGAGRLISSIAPPGQLIALLERGEPVLIAFDVPGSAATPFLGRSVALSGGPATLAFLTGAKVLPVLPERHGTRIDLRMFEPLDPADYRDLPSLRARIARVFEQIVLAKPEIVPFSWFPQPLVTEALSSRAEDSALDAR